MNKYIDHLFIFHFCLNDIFDMLVGKCCKYTILGE